MNAVDAEIARQAEEFKASELRRKTTQLAANLRAAADRVEAIATTGISAVGTPGHQTYAQAVYDIYRELDATLDNSPLRTMITDAAEADVFRAQGAVTPS